MVPLALGSRRSSSACCLLGTLSSVLQGIFSTSPWSVLALGSGGAGMRTEVWWAGRDLTRTSDSSTTPRAHRCPPPTLLQTSQWASYWLPGHQGSSIDGQRLEVDWLKANPEMVLIDSKQVSYLFRQLISGHLPGNWGWGSSDLSTQSILSALCGPSRRPGIGPGSGWQAWDGSLKQLQKEAPV